MIIRHIFYLLLIITFLLSSCNDISDTDSPVSRRILNYNYVVDNQEHGVIFPLREGNFWVYEITYKDKNGIIMCRSQDTITVGCKNNINNDIWYSVSNFFWYETEKFLNTDKGLCLLKNYCNNSACSNKYEAYIVVPYPINKNNYCININSISFTNIKAPDTWIDVGKEDILSSFLGKLNCIKYCYSVNLNNKNIIFRIDYYMPDIGRIRSYEYYFDDENNPNGSSIDELINTNVK